MASRKHLWNDAGTLKLKKKFSDALKQCVGESEELISSILKAWDNFSVAYTKCLRVFQSKGIDQSLIADQYVKYVDLLKSLGGLSNREYVREKVLPVALSVGVVTVEGESRAAVIPPWNPLRLRSIAQQHRDVINAIKSLLDRKNVVDSTYIELMKTQYETPSLPQMAITFNVEERSYKGSPQLHFPVQHSCWYSLMSNN